MAAEPIAERDLIHHRERLRNRLFDCVLITLAERCHKQQISRAAIAKRMGKDPAQVSRLLSCPSNLTTDTLSDLLLAIGADLTLGQYLVEDAPRTNYEHAWSKRHEGAGEIPDRASTLLDFLTRLAPTRPRGVVPSRRAAPASAAPC